MKQILGRTLLVLVILGLLGLGLALGISGYVVHATRDAILPQEDTPPQDLDCILVLGCGIHPDGSPTPMLASRLARGAELYQACVYLTREEEGVLAPVMHLCDMSRWHPGGVDLIAKGGGKRTAILRYLELYGIKTEETIAFGDAENDLTMMRDADFAFAPEDGIIAKQFPNVCKCADGAVADVIYKKIPEILGLNP